MYDIGELRHRIKISNLILPVSCLLIIIAAIIAAALLCGSPYMTQSITDISGEWQYYTDHDSAPKPAQLPGRTEGVYLHENWHLTHTLGDHGINAAILFRSDYLQVSAALDGQEIYRYGYEKTAISSPGKKLVLIPLPEDYPGRQITLTLTPTMNLRAYGIYIGDEASLLSYAVGTSLPYIIISAFVCLLGVSLLGVYLSSRRSKKGSATDFWFSIFVILVGLYIPSKSLLLLMLLTPAQAALMPMLVSFLIPCTVLIFTYTSCERFRVPLLVALCIHVAGFLPTALMQLLSPDPPTEITALFVYLVPVYYGLSVWAFIREIRAGRRKCRRLIWAGAILLFMVFSDRLNSVLGNPLQLRDVETLTKIGLVLFVTIEVVGRIRASLRANAQMLADYQTARVKNRLALEHFQDVKHYMEDVYTLHHDINHHFTALGLMLDQGDMPRAREYLAQLIGDYPMTKQIVYTNNQIVNYSIAYAVKKAEENHIRMVHDIDLPEDICINDSDLYSLFINIIDNAIEAASIIKDTDKRYMELVCNMKNGFVHVQCKNSKENNIIMEDGKYISTKSNDIRHGLGIGIIERIVEKYNGVLDIDFDKNWFTIGLVLKTG